MGFRFANVDGHAALVDGSYYYELSTISDEPIARCSSRRTLRTTDEAADPGSLRIITTVNGEERQNDTVSNLIFDVPTLIAYLSHITTLATGDLIFTGTPAGVGAAQGKFLADGDVIVTTIDDVGSISNRCVRVSDHHSPGNP